MNGTGLAVMRALRRLSSLRRLSLRHLLAWVAAGLVVPSMAQAQGFDLAGYRLTATYTLPTSNPATLEPSAITWNWDTNSLFVIGDEGDAIFEVDKSGVQRSLMSLNQFADTEGLTYIGRNAAGNGQFIVTEERLQTAYLLTYEAGGSVSRSSLPAWNLGPTVGNIGIEGISLDRRDGSFVTVKETSPQQVNRVTLDLGVPGRSTVQSLFTPALGVDDLADVQVLGSFAALAGQGDADHLLVLSQASSRLLEVGRDGRVYSQFDLSSFAANAEGVTIDADGTIFVVNDLNSQMYVLSPVPEPSSLALMGLGLGLTGLAARRRRQR